MLIYNKLNTLAGTIILSIFWGLGLSTLFKKSCDGNNCKVYKYINPNINELKHSYYNYGGKSCYQFEPVLVKCPK
jgi:hypothetical protein